MKAIPFPLDLPGWQAAAAILPESPERERLEAAYRQAWQVWRDHLARREALRNELSAARAAYAAGATRDTARTLSELLLESETWAELTRHRATAYAEALAAWARDAWQTLERIGNRASDAINTGTLDYRKPQNMLSTLPRDDARRSDAAATVAELRKRDIPHIQTRRAAERGLATIGAAVHGAFPTVTRASITPRDIAAFVARHETHARTRRLDAA